MTEQTSRKSHYMYNDHQQAVAEFTEARLGRPIPNKPRSLSRDAVKKFLGLCMSEMVEMARTVTESNAEALELVVSCLGMDPSDYEPEFPDETAIIAEQADAAVDLEYYKYDIFNEHGINLNMVFDSVHGANMLKKFPDGTFHVAEIAPGVRKVIKPPHWKDLGVPNVRQDIEQMQKFGSLITSQDCQIE